MSSSIWGIEDGEEVPDQGIERMGSEQFVDFCLRMEAGAKAEPLDYHSKLVCDLVKRLEKKYALLLPERKEFEGLPPMILQMAEMYAHHLGHVFFQAGRLYEQDQIKADSFEDVSITDITGTDDEENDDATD